MADPARDDLDRLRSFWERRYQRFVLSESGWSGAGERFNHYVYRCKAQAVRAALGRAHIGRAASFRVLDAGCGQGYFADFYTTAFPKSRYTGLDLSHRVVEHLCATRPDGEFVVGDLSSWPQDDTRRFDVIQSLEVLHLMLDDDLVAQAFRNFARLLGNDGLVLITVPALTTTVTSRDYLRYRPASRLRPWWETAGLREQFRLPMYYWMPDAGPSWTWARPFFFRLPPFLIYASDRVARGLRFPRAATGPDSMTELVALKSAGNEPR